jgi:hypothetical protein
MNSVDPFQSTQIRTPPHDIRAEESLLGAMLLSDKAVSIGIEKCSIGDFYKPAHGHIFASIRALSERGEPIDQVTVAAEMERMGTFGLIGDPTIFISLQANVPSIPNAGTYAEIVTDNARLRRWMAAGEDIVTAARDGNASAAELRAQQIIEDIRATSPNASGLFRRWTMPEVLAEPTDFTWLINGLMAHPTYAVLAGEMKTLKSYLLSFMMVGLAAGVPIFDKFVPGQARPVLAYVGEGGQALWTRRIYRICEAMGVKPADLDLHPSFDVAPIQSDLFQRSLRRDLADIKPALFGLDPLYAFHGTESRASDLHQEGALLNRISKPCMDVGTSAAVVNHFNQTGNGTSLKRITMSGSGEWADSWILVAHREDPDVDAGLFQLTLEIGSRQWGGTAWDLDLDIGHFDQDTGSHDGEISWDLRRASGGSGRKSTKDDAKAVRARQDIIDILTDCPWELTKSKIKVMVGGGRQTFDDIFNKMVEDGEIAHDKVGRVRDHQAT